MPRPVLAPAAARRARPGRPAARATPGPARPHVVACALAVDLHRPAQRQSIACSSASRAAVNSLARSPVASQKSGRKRIRSRNGESGAVATKPCNCAQAPRVERQVVRAHQPLEETGRDVEGVLAAVQRQRPRKRRPPGLPARGAPSRDPGRGQVGQERHVGAAVLGRHRRERLATLGHAPQQQPLALDAVGLGGGTVEWLGLSGRPDLASIQACSASSRCPRWSLRAGRRRGCRRGCRRARGAGRPPG